MLFYYIDIIINYYVAQYYPACINRLSSVARVSLRPVVPLKIQLLLLLLL